MAHKYACDHCYEQFISPPAVTLNGVSGAGGGILLPQAFAEKHFCNPACFWKWCRQYLPDFLRRKIQQESPG